MTLKKNEEFMCCRFCERSVEVMDEDNVLCEKKGIVSKDHVCGGFRLDLIKVKPSAKVIPEPDAELMEQIADL